MKSREPIDWLREIKRLGDTCEIIQLRRTLSPVQCTTSGLFIQGLGHLLHRQYYVAKLSRLVSIKVGNYRFVQKCDRLHRGEPK